MAVAMAGWWCNGYVRVYIAAAHDYHKATRVASSGDGRSPQASSRVSVSGTRPILSFTEEPTSAKILRACGAVDLAPSCASGMRNLTTKVASLPDGCRSRNPEQDRVSIQRKVLQRRRFSTCIRVGKIADQLRVTVLAAMFPPTGQPRDLLAGKPGIAAGCRRTYLSPPESKDPNRAATAGTKRAAAYRPEPQ